VVRSAGWVFAGKFAGRGLTMVKLVVLARLLAPEDFGLFGIVMLAMAAIETFTQTGFGQALIQRRDDARAHLDTAWTVQLVRSFVLAGLLFAAAPLVAWFFDEPRAVALLRALSLVKVVDGFRNVGTIYWQKDLEFNRRVIYDFAVACVSVGVGIALAFVLRNVWALVWSSVAGAATGTALSYAMHPYRPRLRWNGAEAKELIGYGVWLLGSSIMIYCGSQLDNLFVGKLLGTAALGFYVMAYRLSLLPLQETTYAIGGVLMPGYAKVQGDRDRVRLAYERALGLTAMLAVPVCLGMIVVAHPAVALVLGDQWLPAVGPIQILMAAQLLKSIISTGSPLFLGTGVPRYEFQMQLVRSIALAVCLVPGIMFFELNGAALAVVGSALAMFVAYVRAIRHILGGVVPVFRNTLLPPLAGGTAMLAVLGYPALVLARYPAPVWTRVMLLAALIVGGAIVYFPMCLGVSRWFPGSSIHADVKSFLYSFRRKLASFRPNALCRPVALDEQT